MATALLLLTTAALLLACGPASEARGGERVEFQLHQESEPTPTPTATPALTPAEKYPKLDPVLQKVVGGFEAEEWTETGAASQALMHHGLAVLVEIDTSAAAIDAVDAWMGEEDISPRFKGADYDPPHIYAYVPVSILGALSRREGVSAVWTVEGAGESPPPRGVLGQAGTPPKPKLPFWLKGSEYAKLQGLVQGLVLEYERGELTAEEVAASTFDPKGSSILTWVHMGGDRA